MSQIQTKLMNCGNQRLNTDVRQYCLMLEDWQHKVWNLEHNLSLAGESSKSSLSLRVFHSWLCLTLPISFLKAIR